MFCQAVGVGISLSGQESTQEAHFHFDPYIRYPITKLWFPEYGRLRMLSLQTQFYYALCIFVAEAEPTGPTRCAWRPSRASSSPAVTPCPTPCQSASCARSTWRRPAPTRSLLQNFHAVNKKGLRSKSWLNF